MTRRLGMAILAGCCAFGWFFWLALGRWNAGRSTAYDLGIFSQSAQSYARLRLPHSDIRGLDLLGDHFSPIIALWGPVWKAWPDPRVLLLAQAALLALAVGGIVAFALSRGLGVWSVGILLLLLMARGLIAPDLFDVHEVAFAAPLVVLLCWAVSTWRLRPAVLAAVGLVLTKEDLGLTVAAAGIAWWVIDHRDARDNRLRGAFTLLGVGAAGLLLALVVMAAVKGGASSYLGYFGGQADLALPLQRPQPQWHRLLPLLLFTVSAGVIGWRSPLAIIAVPTLAWRMVSSSFNFWRIDFHYDLVPTCIAAMALIEAWSRRPAPRWRPGLALTAVAGLVLGAVQLADKAVAPVDSLTTAVDVRDLRSVMAHVPAGERVIASNDTGAYLVPRYDVYTLTRDRQESARWVVFILGPRWRSFYPSCAREQLAGSGIRRWRAGDVVLIQRGPSSPLPAPSCHDAPLPVP